MLAADDGEVFAAEVDALAMDVDEDADGDHRGEQAGAAVADER